MDAADATPAVGVIRPPPGHRVEEASGQEELGDHGQQAEAQEALVHCETPFHAAGRGFPLPSRKSCAADGVVQPN